MLVLAEVLQDGELAQAAAQLQHVGCRPHLWQQARHGRSDGVGGAAWEVRRGRCGVGGAARPGLGPSPRPREQRSRGAKEQRSKGDKEQGRRDVKAARASQP